MAILNHTDWKQRRNGSRKRINGVGRQSDVKVRLSSHASAHGAMRARSMPLSFHTGNFDKMVLMKGPFLTQYVSARIQEHVERRCEQTICGKTNTDCTGSAWSPKCYMNLHSPSLSRGDHRVLCTLLPPSAIENAVQRHRILQDLQSKATAEALGRTKLSAIPLLPLDMRQSTDNRVFAEDDDDVGEVICLFLMVSVLICSSS